MRKRVRRSGVVLACLLPLAGCLDWSNADDYVRPGTGSGPSEPSQPAGPAPGAELCGLENLAAVVELACSLEAGLCASWSQCDGVFTPFESCVAERTGACQERVLFGLQAGACFLPQVFAANDAGGCHATWQQTQGSCVAPIMEELTATSELCQQEWTPGAIPEGGACLYGAPGCAAPDAPELFGSCAYESSFEPGGGSCRWFPDLPRGASCDPEASDYCNRSDACLSSGICDQRRALGADCAVDNDCASLLCADGVCTDPEGFSCAERSCPVSWSCVDERCARRERT